MMQTGKELNALIVQKKYQNGHIERPTKDIQLLTTLNDVVEVII